MKIQRWAIWVLSGRYFLCFDSVEFLLEAGIAFV